MVWIERCRVVATPLQGLILGFCECQCCRGVASTPPGRVLSHLILSPTSSTSPSSLVGEIVPCSATLRHWDSGNKNGVTSANPSLQLLLVVLLLEFPVFFYCGCVGGWEFLALLLHLLLHFLFQLLWACCLLVMLFRVSGLVLALCVCVCSGLLGGCNFWLFEFQFQDFVFDFCFFQFVRAFWGHFPLALIVNMINLRFFFNIICCFHCWLFHLGKVLLLVLLVCYRARARRG